MTVVSGLPRSGTSLMMQMLHAGGMPVLTDGVRAADPDNPRGYWEYEPVKSLRSASAWVPDAVGKAVKVIHALIPLLPATCEYRVIAMRRDVREVVESQKAMLERLGRQGANLPPKRLEHLLEAQLEDTLAWLAAQSNCRVLEVQHRECLASPETVARAVNEYLDQQLDSRRMAAIVEPELYRRRPAGI